MAPIDFSRIRRTLLVTAFAVGAAVCAQSAEEKEEIWRKANEALATSISLPNSPEDSVVSPHAPPQSG